MGAEWASHALVHEWFEAAARRRPDAVALVSAQRSMRYAELEARSAELARRLADRGVGPEVVVGVYAESSIELVVALLGVLRAGGAFLPLSPSYPAPRVEAMLAVARPALVIADPTRSDHPALRGARVLELDVGAEVAAAIDPPRPALSAANLAYVIFTSGSSGTPKGVAVSHAGVPNLVRQQHQLFAIDEHSRVLQFASPSFDAAVSEVFTALCAGATLVVIDASLRAQPDRLEHLLAEERITTVTLPPSLLRVLDPARLPELATVVSAGEPCSADLVRRWAPGRRFVNAYGPTETTVCATGTALTDDQDAAPIGPAIGGATAYVLDDALQPVDEGELFVGGVGVARGYLGRPAETAQRFVPDPFGDRPGARLYRTGDLVRRRGDGQLEYLGRRDEQVKVRGVRIELGEIEACLRAHPAVSDAAVVVQRRADDTPLLAAFVCAAAAPASLRAHLRTQLPPALVPAWLEVVDSLPVTPNGKVDRRALAERPGARAAAVTGPETELERGLAACFRAVLGLGTVDVRDSFFDVGGDSLAALRLVRLVAAKLGQRVPVAALFERRSVRELARFLEAGDSASRTILPLCRDGDAAPLWLAAPVHGSGLCYLDVAELLAAEDLRPIFALQSPGVEGEREPALDYDAVVEEYVAAIRGAQPDGPYLLGGWSLGGTFAYECAARLQAAGAEVAGLVLIDATAPSDDHLEVSRRLMGDYPMPRCAYMYARSFCHTQGVEFALPMAEFEAGGDDGAVAAACRALAGIGPFADPVDPALLRRLIGIYRANLYAFHHHRPSPRFRGPALVLESEKGRPFLRNNPVVAEKLPFGKWEDFIDGAIERHTVPGDHFRLVSGAYAAPVSAHVARWLAALSV